jgi:hypothetical protein
MGKLHGTWKRGVGRSCTVRYVWIDQLHIQRFASRELNVDTKVKIIDSRF